MNTFAISLYGAEGKLHCFAVTAPLLVRVYQTLMDSPDSEPIQAIAPEAKTTPKPEVKPTPAPKPAPEPGRDDAAFADSLGKLIASV